ncbi:MAG: MoaD/ThiS family protein [Haliea sp.]|uniref:MoaD/ThiS family protein n=1 Tax=Haliea sp. TaxID=1932666 RepID=UPI0032EC2025
MAHVVFPGHLLAVTDGEAELDVPACNVRELLAALEQRFPDAGDELRKSTIAIDGLICQDAFLETLRPDSEVFFMPRIAGG